MEAYILINAKPGMIWQVAEVTLKIEGVKKAHAVAGQFDVVVYAEFTKVNDLGAIIEHIQRIKGVHRTQTLIAIPSPIRK